MPPKGKATESPAKVAAVSPPPSATSGSTAPPSALEPLSPAPAPAAANVHPPSVSEQLHELLRSSSLTLSGGSPPVARPVSQASATQADFGRQPSFGAYTVQNYASGAALPLRLPSVRETNGTGASGAVAKNGGGGDGAQDEAGTTLAQEAGRMMWIAGPLLVEGLTNIGTQLVATTTVARLGGGGPVALSALVLAQTQLNFAYSIVCGVAAALETCCGQAFGAQQYALLGLVLQCAQALCLMVAAPAAIAWGTGAMTPVLVWLGQLPEVASAAGRLLQLTWPVLPLLALSETTAQYLLAQGVAAPASVAGLTTLGLAVPAYWATVGWMGWLPGVAAAQVALQVLSVIVLVGWCVARDHRVARTDPERATWQGWSLESLRGLPHYASYAVPAAAMLCLEWWVWELVVFLTGLLPPDKAEVQLGAIGFVMQVSLVTWMVSYSVGTATATRIANAYGAGQALNARRIFRMSCCLLLCVNSLVAVTIWGLRHPLVTVLTPDAAIRHEVKRILPAAVIGIIGDGQVAVLGGLLRAAGRQSAGATLHFVTYWLVGLPAGCLLGFVFEMGALGLWLGVAAATSLQAVGLHIWVMCRMDWKHEVLRSEATVGAMCEAHAITDLPSDGGSSDEEEGRGAAGGGAPSGPAVETAPLLPKSGQRAKR